jgi:hypothetical protein
MESKEELNILEVIHSGDTFKFRLFPQGQPSLGPTHRVFSTKVSESVLQDICLRIDKLQEKSIQGKDVSWESLKEVGALLYQSFLPAGLQQFLRSCGKYLLILTEEAEFPWELLYDGENFLGLKYSVGRCLMWNEEVSIKPSKRRRSLSFLIIANPADNLPETEHEAATLLEYLKQRGLNCTYLAGPQATTTEILLQFNSGKHDVIHYCGHIDNALCLADGQKLGVNEISKASINNAPLIFLNGCSSTKNMLLENHIGNLASAFLSTGVQAVIGTTRKVTDLGARSFAESFYSSILEGETLGEALRKTAQALHTKNSADFTWASFVMYGVPNVYLVDKTQSEGHFPEWLNVQKLDQRIQEIVNSSIELAEKNNSSVSTIHLFLSMIRTKNSLMRRLLGVDLQKVENAFSETSNFFRPKATKQLKKTDIKFSSNTQKILKATEEIATSDKSDLIKEMHLIKAFAKSSDTEAYKLLQRLGVDIQTIVEGKETEAEKQLSLQVRLALYVAGGLAADCGNAVVGTPHLFAGICALGDGPTRQFLHKQNIDPEELIEKIGNVLSLKDEGNVRIGSLAITNFSDNLKIVLEHARELASAEGSMSIEERHLVLSILENSKYSTAKMLENFGVDAGALRKNLEKF